MREIFGNMWDIECDAVCITTNGIVKKDGTAVMGAGVAKQAKERFAKIDLLLGKLIQLYGNRVHLLTEKTQSNPALVSFPTKNNFKDDSPIELIEQSSHQLVTLTNEKRWETVVLSRPGCGNGNLAWNYVRQTIEPIFDDRFFIVTWNVPSLSRFR
jgi:hypothetical protein